MQERERRRQEDDIDVKKQEWANNAWNKEEIAIGKSHKVADEKECRRKKCAKKCKLWSVWNIPQIAKWWNQRQNVVFNSEIREWKKEHHEIEPAVEGKTIRHKGRNC